ncbi:MAG: sigma-54-dependent Fis family transcriptional regulator [Gemmatimonadetes bacterium]|nr:sigma-54-dependent Fis family transcriptional regulator [Gemmatimonadota bacterium]
MKPVVVGSSAAMREIRSVIRRAAPTNASVLIRGETGTGKELVARAFHAESHRAAGPFVAVNCAAIPEHLLESELFGHEKGAFTGTTGRRTGRFERANGGTLFLDEIGDMSAPLQAKILRALQEREIERVGGSAPVRVNLRVLAATHRDLEAAITAGEFRSDLFYRLAVVEIELPPLRNRGADLDELIDHLVALFARQHGRPVTSLAEPFRARLHAHDWPGNVRELGNAIERAVVMSKDGVLRQGELPKTLAALPASETVACRFPTLAEAEREHIRKALELAGGNRSQAARLLGIERNTLARKMKKYGLLHP